MVVTVERLRSAKRGPAKESAARTASVRMYRHGLGDCFLLRFPKDSGGAFSVLIDCGLIAVAKDPKTTMKKVVADISKTCGARLDVVILTHEHWDHVSGFSKQQVQEEFEAIDIGEVWYAWTEDPDNALGVRLRRERESKLRALQAAVAALRAKDDGAGVAMRRAERIESLLNFFGGASLDEAEPDLLGAAGAGGKKIGKTRAAFDYLRTRPGVKRRYCHPASKPISLDGVSGVRVFVLGPPEDEGMLKRSAPTKKGKEVYEFAGDMAIDENLSAAFERLRDPVQSNASRDCPFDSMFAKASVNGIVSGSAKLQTLLTDVWHAPDGQWRQIEDEWTDAAETLALNLDNHTNNTCLVVAFELLPSRKVLLFAADAQVGNWLSWHNTRWRIKEGNETSRVTGLDLLQRTVFYKVGHHGSHNATLRALGLEQMTSGELVAFVPVEKSQAEKSGWKEMSFTPLVKRLQEKASGRVVFSDSVLVSPSAADLSALSGPERAQFEKRLQSDPDGLFYEYSVDL